MSHVKVCELRDWICPKCRSSANVRRHGRLTRKFLDLELPDKIIDIAVSRQRFRCSTCGQCFLQPIAGVVCGRSGGLMSVTLPLAKWIGRQASHMSNVRLASITGLNEKTIRNVLSRIEEINPKE